MNDGILAIDHNLGALKRVLAGIVAMAGLANGARTLPRHIHLAVLRLLRPAEAAARRLVIALSRGMVVTLQPKRLRKPPLVYVQSVIGRHAGVRSLMVWQPGAPASQIIPLPLRSASIRICFSLFDPLRCPFRRRIVAPHLAPRIRSLANCAPVAPPFPSPPSPDDPINATRLGLRLAALGRVLDDLPAQARRFAHWQARTRVAAGAQGKDHASPLARQSNIACAAFGRSSPDARPVAAWTASICPQSGRAMSARSTKC